MEAKTAAYVLTGVGFGVCLGFFLRGRMLSVRNLTPKTPSRRKSSSSGSSDEGSVSGDEGSEMKLVIVVRQDLKMGKGKIAAQCSHAAVSAYKQLNKRDNASLRRWEYSGQPKVVVKCTNEEELLALYQHARVMNLTTSVIQDAGRTQIMPGSKTVLGVGPGPEEKVNVVTGHLKLM
ncbi:peptidyl-tRNA hydrolase 2, mitochondrial-like [Styela clava]|uniref:peptidyl-tRNA hydrolase 2, mitochondrial-like n=1 Tax=Styela clava TaxID=7725 RepID=UPI00193A8F2A|nr:peptidyl-tRNA hydrolase 2, mitochondrial-like [Styela clava]